MTPQQEAAMRQALEALESNVGADHPLRRNSIIDLRQALEQQPADKPSYWLGYGLQAHTEKPFEEATPLYIRPQPAAWVGLTPEDRGQCLKAGGDHGWIGVMEATEAKLREKNGGKA